MKTTLLSLLCLLVLLPDSASAKDSDRQIAYIVAPFVPILKERRPESKVIVLTSKGQQFFVKQVGEYWVEVYVPPNNEVGWIELGLENPKVEIRTESDMSPFMRGLLVGIVSLLVAAAAIFLVVRYLHELRHKKALAGLGNTPQG